MIKGLGKKIMVASFALPVAFSAYALADDGGEDIPKDRQEKLLEKFGDEGIDADGDGILTREEVRAFWAAKRDDPQDAKYGQRGGRGMRERGRRDGDGRGPGPMGGMAQLLDRLEMLQAESAPGHFDLKRFPDADTDGDGELSDAEWTAFAAQQRERMLTRLASRFPLADADDDGTINEEELAALKAKVRAQCLKRNPEADTDGDGALSEGEYKAFRESRDAERRARFLERHPEADTDGNGVLSDEEERAARGPRRGWGGDRDGLRDRGPGFGPEDMKGQRGARILERNPEADTDGDGTLSESELEAFRAARHARILEDHPEADLDGDGVLSAEEARAFMGGRRGQRGPGPHRGGPQEH